MRQPLDGLCHGHGHAARLPFRAQGSRGSRRRSREALVRADDDFASLVASSSPVPMLHVTSNHPFDSPKASALVPPLRPSSTPFPHPDNRSPSAFLLDGAGILSDAEPTTMAAPTMPVDHCASRPPRAIHFDELPMEVHEAIVDHLFGFSIAPTSNSLILASSLPRRWGSSLRHSRRREIADLALVNRRWTILIQQRLYRHIKIKATVDFIENAILHLAGRHHLASHIKHVEIWFPVFQPMYGSLASSNSLALPTVTANGLTNAAYVLPENNCTLEEVFRFVALMVPEAQVLTLEGGERRKAPKVIHRNKRPHDPTTFKPLRAIPSVRTLVTRGQWNLMRDHRDFANILQALPNLEEWQGSYSKPKSKSYISLAHYLPSMPCTIRRLSLCMENDYRCEASTPSFYAKVVANTHLCASLGHVLPGLEHFSYTGRLCHALFDLAARFGDPLRSRLRSVDVTVKNCCRHPDGIYPGTGSGIHEMGFIEAFEKLVLAAIRCLEKHEALQYLRIRFVDLDSLLPPLNPYFLLTQQQCSGVWSDAIVTEMARVRPGVSFVELSESFGNIVCSKEGRVLVTPDMPRSRIMSLKLNNYRALANRMTIQ